MINFSCYLWYVSVFSFYFKLNREGKVEIRKVSVRALQVDSCSAISGLVTKFDGGRQELFSLL